MVFQYVIPILIVTVVSIMMMIQLYFMWASSCYDPTIAFIAVQIIVVIESMVLYFYPRVIFLRYMFVHAVVFFQCSFRY